MKSNYLNLLGYFICAVLMVPLSAFSEEPSTEAEPNLIGEPTGVESRAFFTAGAAGSPFQGDIEITKPLEPQMLGARAKEKPKTVSLKKREVKRFKDSKKPFDKPAATKEELFERYGAPEETPPVLGREDAPKPIVAMLDALEMGDTEVAYGYARQYARYMKALNERASKISTMSDLAMQSEGLKPVKTLSEDPQYDDIRKYFEEDLKKQNEWVSSRINLDPRTREMIERAISEEDKALHPTVVEKSEKPAASAEEQKARQQIRLEMAKKVPVDPKGKVDVYLFFNRNQKQYAELFSHFAAFFEAFKGISDVGVVAMTIEPSSEYELSNLRNKAQAVFPIRDGTELAKKAKISKNGTLLFVARTTGEAAVEEGGRNHLFIEEVVNLMRGR